MALTSLDWLHITEFSRKVGGNLVQSARVAG